MQGWSRKRGAYMVKTTSLTDGEMLYQILGKRPNAYTEIDERVYQSLQSVKSASGKATFWILGSSAFGVMSHLGVVKAASASGLELSPVVFSHAALLVLSFATAAFCFSFSKQTFLQSWFLQS